MAAAPVPLSEQEPGRSAAVALPAERSRRARAPLEPARNACSSLAPVWNCAGSAGRRSITIPRAARRAAADGPADRPYPGTDRGTFPGVAADRSAHSSYGRSAGRPAQWTTCHRLARRLPVVARRRIILRILRSRRGRHCRNNPNRRAATSHQTNHFNSAASDKNRAMVRRWQGERQQPPSKRSANGPGTRLSVAPLACRLAGPMLAFRSLRGLGAW